MATKVMPTFEVDKAGMAKVFARKGKAFVITELIQNAWDEDTTAVDVVIEPKGKGKFLVVVEDDNPEGFKDLAHAYTLFAESEKKDKANKRGRFNLGEKLVIAVCENAAITTTKGTILFNEKGRIHTDEKRKVGSIFKGTIALTDDEVKEIEAAVFSLIPPGGILTTFNHEPIPEREPLRTFNVTLRTELADAEGRIKPTTRKTDVAVFEVGATETAAIYEMGIPVVETGDRFHVNIGQKIPLNTDRDNVPPGYLRDVRVAVLNATYDLLTDADTKAGWVTDAMQDENADPAAVKAAFAGKFGDNAVIYDPNDPEANKIAMEQGYTVVPGGALPKAAWGNVKGGGIALPAGQVTPSPKPHADGAELKLMDEAHWPSDVKRVAEWMREFGMRVTGATDIKVRVANAPTQPFAAMYGRLGSTGQYTFNLGRLGYKWFERGRWTDQVDQGIHEFGHHYCSDHLDRRYLDALTRLAGEAVQLALEEPEFFDAVRPEKVIA